MEDRVNIEEQIGIALAPISDFIADDSVSDIFVYGKSRVFIKRMGERTKPVDRKWREDIDLIVACNTIAQKMKRKLNRENPILDARLQDGSRVNIVISPVYSDGACISIRKFPSLKLSGKDLIDLKTLDINGFLILKYLIHTGKRIVISGGTGTGKTTLLNILCNFIKEGEIVVSIEDARELNLSNRMWVPLESKKAFFENEKEVSLRDLIINSLRMFPKWIILGEVRGGEVFDLMRAFNSGHSGISTLHANSCEDALFALENMFLQGKEMSINAVKQIICRAVDIVIQLERGDDEVIRISEISEVLGVKQDGPVTEYILNSLYAFEENHIKGTPRGRYVVKNVPSFIKNCSLAEKKNIPDFWKKVSGVLFGKTPSSYK